MNVKTQNRTILELSSSKFKQTHFIKMSLVGYILKWPMIFQQREMLNTKYILDFSGQDLLRTPLVTNNIAFYLPDYSIFFCIK